MNNFKLTFTQCKQIINNGYDLKEVLNDLNEIPEWAHLEEIADIKSIMNSGCGGNAHISCYYSDAKRIFLAHSDEIEKVLEEVFDCEPPVWNVQEDTFAQFISSMLQTAVEFICYGFVDILDGVNWD